MPSPLQLRRRVHLFGRRTWRRVVQLHGNPHAIALGLAIGTFIACTPTIMGQMLLAAGLAWACGANRVAAALATWVTNPLTFPLVFILTYFLGCWAMAPFGFVAPHTGLVIDFDSWHELIEVIRRLPGAWWAMLVGGVLLGAPSAVGAYYLGRHAIDRYRNSRGGPPAATPLRRSRAA